MRAAQPSPVEQSGPEISQQRSNHAGSELFRREQSMEISRCPVSAIA